jgi:hypothetical protein
MTGDQAPGQRLPGRPSALWWGYFALSIVLFGIGFVGFVIEGFFASFSAMLLSWAQSSADAVCIAGLFAYILSIPLFVPTFWKAMLALLFTRILVSASLFGTVLFPWESSPEQYVALVGLASMLLAVPMVVALWIYAFKSPHIWRSTASWGAVAPAR